MFDTEKYIDFTTEQSPPPEEPMDDKNIVEPPEGDTIDDVIDTKCNASNIIIRNNNRNIRPVQFANSAVSLDF